MATYYIKYALRLGDIVGCLPIADALAQRGHEVLFWCNEEYWSIFDCVDYVRPVGFCPAKAILVDLAVWPDRYNDYRASGIHWQEYVYGMASLIIGQRIDPQSKPRFTNTAVDLASYGLVSGEFDLVAPYGISQQWKPTIAATAIAAQNLGVYKNLKVLTPYEDGAGDGFVCARKLSDLPGLIQHARKFLCINSAPNIIAAGVRKEWYCFRNPDFNGQDQITYEGQILV